MLLFRRRKLLWVLGDLVGLDALLNRMPNHCPSFSLNVGPGRCCRVVLNYCGPILTY
jgi:hypothetical protein